MTTAEIGRALSLSRGELYSLIIWTDREVTKAGNFSKGRKTPAIVHESLPELLRAVASLAEQEDGTLEGVAELVREKQSKEAADA